MKKTFITASILLASLLAVSQRKENVKTDTTKHYYVIGDFETFKALYLAVASPDDITANQRKAILAWLDKNVAVLSTDSTKKK